MARQLWTGANDYEVSDKLARAIVKTFLPIPEIQTKVLDPCAGTGVFAQFLPVGSICVDINTRCVELGKVRAPHCHWVAGDFIDDLRLPLNRFDLIVAKPPLSLGLEVLEKSLNMLTPHYYSSVVLLLPLNYFSDDQRGHELTSLNCHIHSVYRILSKPKKSSHVFMGVFEFKLGVAGGVFKHLVIE